MLLMKINRCWYSQMPPNWLLGNNHSRTSNPRSKTVGPSGDGISPTFSYSTTLQYFRTRVAHHCVCTTEVQTVYEQEVQFYTDHQAITTIGSAKLEPANRIKRFIDIIQSFNPSIYFIPGQFNFIADFYPDIIWTKYLMNLMKKQF